MLQQPKGRKFKHERKARKGQIRDVAYKGTSFDKGSFGIKAMSSGRISAAQLEAIRVALKRVIKKTGRIFFRIFPQKPVTAKPIGVRGGGGKGSLDHWVAIVSAGRMLCEFEGVSEEIAKRAFESASYKIGVQTKFVRRLI